MLGDLITDDEVTITLLIAISHARALLTTSDDGTARLHNVVTGAVMMSLAGHAAPVIKAAATPDGDLIVTGDAQGTLIVWDGGSGERRQCVRFSEDPVCINDVAMSPCGTVFAAASMAEDGVTLWSTDEAVMLSHWHHVGARSVAFSPTGRVAMSISFDGTQMMWNVAAGVCLRVLRRSELLLDVAFAATGDAMGSRCSGSRHE